MVKPSVVLMGPPGAGKGTQASNVATEFGIEHIETGAVLRENKDMETSEGTPREYIEQGEYVPDSVMNELIEELLSGVDGFVLDGYPRTQSQVAKLDEITDLDVVLFLAVSEETLINRLSKRRVCANCGNTYHLEFQPPESPEECDGCGGELIQREDDSPEKIKTRLHEYMEKTESVIEEYRSRSSLVEIDGEQSPQEVWTDIQEAVHANVQ